jgi:predicted DCC family thiol-disulfide oxidoreductase YuxK
VLGRAPGGMLTRPVLVYDGQCGFCRDWVSRLERWGLRGMDLLPSQRRQERGDLPSLSDDQVDREMVVVLPDRRVLGGGAAMGEVWGRVPRLRLIAMLLSLPGISVLRDAGYRWVAARRKRDGCEVPAR